LSNFIKKIIKKNPKKKLKHSTNKKVMVLLNQLMEKTSFSIILV